MSSKRISSGRLAGLDADAITERRRHQNKLAQRRLRAKRKLLMQQAQAARVAAMAAAFRCEGGRGWHLDPMAAPHVVQTQHHHPWQRQSWSGPILQNGLVEGGHDWMPSGPTSLSFDASAGLQGFQPPYLDHRNSYASSSASSLAASHPDHASTGVQGVYTTPHDVLASPPPPEWAASAPAAHHMQGTAAFHRQASLSGPPFNPHMPRPAGQCHPQAGAVPSQPLSPWSLPLEQSRTALSQGGSDEPNKPVDLCAPAFAFPPRDSLAPRQASRGMPSDCAVADARDARARDADYCAQTFPTLLNHSAHRPPQPHPRLDQQRHEEEQQQQQQQHSLSHLEHHQHQHHYQQHQLQGQQQHRQQQQQVQGHVDSLVTPPLDPSSTFSSPPQAVPAFELQDPLKSDSLSNFPLSQGWCGFQAPMASPLPLPPARRASDLAYHRPIQMQSRLEAQYAINVLPAGSMGGAPSSQSELVSQPVAPASHSLEMAWSGLEATTVKAPGGEHGALLGEGLGLIPGPHGSA
ncbi:uncharacterized protein PFL1_03000 [Pseudozyma flocculosa PF-1]|uniref:BZIP domain-containing protein n=2 Tax=Pseudozyma flocculosa TaxID=84751 RepID=A0A5C3F160_9BASI|nr:uncharacterized protein PFL1_03000 [Pseudozyma flocculosa PF-1]EPQ29245.1 hypothetical protein PFL1_03000 [Pseudozyma flocculosa PF-1]SPO37745.1 uncharacterized protein PSFLO_03221 [Pseudozyma flocculosa]